MALVVDKLKIANVLVNGDVPREAAEEFAEAIADIPEVSATEAEVAQEIETLDSKTDARFEAMMARMDARFAQIDARFAQIDARFDVISEQIRALEDRMDKKMAQMEARIYWAIGGAAALIIAAMSAWAAFS